MPGHEADLDRAAAPGTRLQDAQVKSPWNACGRTVTFLMKAPEFAAMPFGHLSRLIIGSINRGQYFFVVDEDETVQGYCGWAQVTRAAADAWLEESRDITREPGSAELSGEAPVSAINLWKASSPAVNTAMIGALRRRLPPSTELVVARRFYADGRMRPLRLPISAHQLRH